MGSHQAVRRSQGWAPLTLLPPLSSLLSPSPSSFLSPLLPHLPTPGGDLDGRGQGWKDSEGTVCAELGASYIFCFINQ